MSKIFYLFLVLVFAVFAAIAFTTHTKTKEENKIISSDKHSYKTNKNTES